MHPTSFTRHSSHKVTNEMYIIKTKHKSSVNTYCVFQGRVQTMVTQFTSKQHENYIPNQSESRLDNGVISINLSRTFFTGIGHVLEYIDQVLKIHSF